MSKIRRHTFTYGSQHDIADRLQRIGINLWETEFLFQPQDNFDDGKAVQAEVISEMVVFIQVCASRKLFELLQDEFSRGFGHGIYIAFYPHIFGLRLHPYFSFFPEEVWDIGVAPSIGIVKIFQEAVYGDRVGPAWKVVRLDKFNLDRAAWHEKKSVE